MFSCLSNIDFILGFVNLLRHKAINNFKKEYGIDWSGANRKHCSDPNLKDHSFRLRLTVSTHKNYVLHSYEHDWDDNLPFQDGSVPL